MKQTITYAFRRPKFPLICDLDGDVFAAGSPAGLQRRLGDLDLTDGAKMRIVDASGESWMIFPEEMILAPGFPLRKWRKIEVINMFNGRRNATESGVRYPEHRLANRRLDRIVREIAAFLTLENRKRAGVRTQAKSDEGKSR